MPSRWRFAPLIVFGLLLLIFLFVRGREYEILEGREGEKILSFQHLNVTGYVAGKKDWHIECREGWVTKGETQSHFFGVNDGEVYRQGLPVVVKLRAGYVRRERHSKILQGFAHPLDTEHADDAVDALTARLDLHSVTEEAGTPSWYDLRAEELMYNENRSASVLTGNVILIGETVTMGAEKIEINHDKKTATADKNVFVRGKNFELEGGKVEATFPDGVFEITEKAAVTITSDKEKPTKLHAGIIRYFEDEKKPIEFFQRIFAEDENKKVSALGGYLDRSKNELALMGAVRVVFPPGEGQKLLKEETREKLENPESRETIRAETRLTCDQFIINTKTHHAEGVGSVWVQQEGKYARSDRVTYDHENEILHLSGNVEIQKKGDWLKTRYVDVSITDETFTAGDVVEARFKLDVEDEEEK